MHGTFTRHDLVDRAGEFMLQIEIPRVEKYDLWMPIFYLESTLRLACCLFYHRNFTTVFDINLFDIRQIL